MMYLFCILICFVATVTHGHSSRVLEDIIVEDIGVVEGDDLSILCNVTKSPDVDIYWAKNESGSVFHSDGVVLNFTHINRTDHGEYVCISVDNRTNTTTEIQAVKINVLYKARVKSITIEPSELMEHETYTVTCEVEGNPPPLWHIWNNYTKEILGYGQGSGTIITKNLTSSCGDTGPIKCLARNEGNGKVWDSMFENITVFCSPRPSTNISHFVESFEGGPAYFIMNVNGYPYPNYTWSRDDGRPIKHAVHLDFPTGAVLKFSNLSIGDFGNYSLTMENAYGSYKSEYAVVALGSPEKPHNLNYSDVTYNSVVLYWTSGFDMGARQTFYIMELLDGDTYTTVASLVDNSTSHGVGQNWSYMVTDLDSDSDITLTVRSINAFGYKSVFDKPGVSFHTLPNPNGGDKPHSPKLGLIIGAIVGSGVVLALAGIIVFVIYKRKRNLYANMT